MILEPNFPHSMATSCWLTPPFSNTPNVCHARPGRFLDLPMSFDPLVQLHQQLRATVHRPAIDARQRYECLGPWVKRPLICEQSFYVILLYFNIFQLITKGSLGYLSSMYFSDFCACGQICLHSPISCCYVFAFVRGGPPVAWTVPFYVTAPLVKK